MSPARQNAVVNEKVQLYDKLIAMNQRANGDPMHTAINMFTPPFFACRRQLPFRCRVSSSGTILVT
jgi:hypothetical protein